MSREKFKVRSEWRSTSGSCAGQLSILKQVPSPYVDLYTNGIPNNSLTGKMVHR